MVQNKVHQIKLSETPSAQIVQRNKIQKGVSKFKRKPRMATIKKETKMLGNHVNKSTKYHESECSVLLDVVVAYL
jgi:hypothetical protein